VTPKVGVIELVTSTYSPTWPAIRQANFVVSQHAKRWQARTTFEKHALQAAIDCEADRTRAWDLPMYPTTG
jgi:hypothetical protein